MASRFFGSRRPIRSHLAKGTHGFSGELADLRTDVEAAFLQQQQQGPALTSYTNLTRPAANTLPAGSSIWNTDDNAPNFSDGTVWRDAMGTQTS